MPRPSLLISLLLLLPISARADWPARTFAPYVYLGMGDDFELTACDDATGLKHYTLAFIIARQEGRGQSATYSPEPAWDGRTPMADNLYVDQITAIRRRGGDVICSFGGEAGKELAQLIEDPARLQLTYQSVLDRYHFTWLDFDVEGNNLSKYPEANRRRNTALSNLQKTNPGLRISYTLPVAPTGLSPASLALLKDAKEKGLKVYTANIMVMYFGKPFINKGKTEGELGIEAANAAREQLRPIDPDVKLALCPCLGRNGSPDEVFTPADARQLVDFARKTPWIAALHYWSINDDAARPRKRPNAATATTRPDMPNTPWTFAKIFLPFTAK